MTALRHSARALRAFLRAEAGNATVEFVIIFPLIFSMMLVGVDAGVAMLRQISLDRSMDIAVREVRLDLLGDRQLREVICENTLLMGSCMTTLAIEMRPVNTETFGTFETTTQCINAEEEINPLIAFDPGAGGEAQELMLLRACVVMSPFIRLAQFVTSIPVNADGDLVLVSHAVFVNEPR